MYNIPCNKDLLQASSIPLATVITPFAETGPSEVSVMIVVEVAVVTCTWQIPKHSLTLKQEP